MNTNQLLMILGGVAVLGFTVYGVSWLLSEEEPWAVSSETLKHLSQDEQKTILKAMIISRLDEKQQKLFLA